MAAHFGFIAHAAQAHADIFAPRCLGDRACERGLADAGRTDEAQDRALELADALLHGEILKDALLDLFQAEMVVVQHKFGGDDVALDLALLAPRQAEQPIEIIAHHRGFRRHGRHGAQLLDLGLRLFARFLGQLGLADAVFQLVHLVAAFFAFAEFLLDRLQLLVQVIFALGLFHLALHARTDLALDLQHADFRFDQRQDFFQPFGGAEGFQQGLALADLDRQMRRNRIRQLGGVIDLRHGGKGLGRDFLVELDVLLEVGLHRAHQRFGFLNRGRFLLNLFDSGLEKITARRKAGDASAALSFDQHANGLVGQLQQLQHGGHRADRVQALGGGIILRRVLLGQKQDLLLVIHHFLEGADGFLAAHEQRNDHVRKDHDVAQRQDRRGVGVLGFDFLGGVIRHDGTPAGSIPGQYSFPSNASGQALLGSRPMADSGYRKVAPLMGGFKAA